MRSVKGLIGQAQKGFTLVEVMITLTLGLLISASIVQVMVSNGVTDKLNRAVASAQEGGRFIVSRMRSELLMTGRYDTLSPNLNTAVDVVDEAAFLQNHPIPLPGDFANAPALGASQGAAGASDVLVVGLQAAQDCRGINFGYAANEEFYVVNEYFLDGSQLKCRGYDGRVLRGQLPADVNADVGAYTLLDDVASFQVMYALTNNVTTGDNSGRPIAYVRADELAAEMASQSQVVGVRLAILLKGDGEIKIENAHTFKLLNEAPLTPNDDHLYKLFETTVTFRNVKNFMRNRKI